jgi:hypothetical protein
LATAPALSGPASRIRTATPRRVSSPISAVQVGRVDHQRPAGQRLRGNRRRPGEGRGPARPEQPGQHGLGDGVGADADQDPLAGGPRGGGDGKQARPGPLGCVDATHAEGRKPVAQPCVRLVQTPRQDQRHRHGCLPAAAAAVTRA